MHTSVFAAGSSWDRIQLKYDVHISCRIAFNSNVVLIYFVLNFDTGTSPIDIVFCSQDEIQNKKKYKEPKSRKIFKNHDANWDFMCFGSTCPAQTLVHCGCWDSFGSHDGRTTVGRCLGWLETNWTNSAWFFAWALATSIPAQWIVTSIHQLIAQCWLKAVDQVVPL